MLKKLKKLSRFEKISILAIVIYLVLAAYISRELREEGEELKPHFSCDYCNKPVDL